MVAFRSLIIVPAALLVGSTSAVTDAVGVNSAISTAISRSIDYPSEDLQSRQLNGISPYDIPVACRQSCLKAINVSDCDDTECICSSEMASTVQSCYSCASAASDKIPQEKYQSVANEYIETCKKAGFNLNPITILKDNGTNVNGTNVNGTSPNGTSVNGTDSSVGKNNGAFGVAPTFGILTLSAAALILA